MGNKECWGGIWLPLVDNAPQAAAITSVKCLLALLEDQGGGVGERSMVGMGKR